MAAGIWVVWRDGRMGSWSLAHLADISGNTLCGVEVGEYPQLESNLDGTFTHCSECQRLDGLAHELSKTQITRQDCVDNAIRAMLNELAGKECEWDIAVLATIREAAEPFVRGATGMTEREFYPYLAEE